MNERLTSAIRRTAAGLSAFFTGAVDFVLDWIYGGDVTAMVVLGAIALVMLLIVVVPSGRRY